MTPLRIDEGARPATGEDLDDIVALAAAGRDELEPTRGGSVYFRREGRPAGSGALVQALDQDDHHVVVGTVDGTVVGYGLVRAETLHDGRLLGVIDDLFVLPGARGVGVGEAMMDALIAFCRSLGCIGIDAVALPGNRDTKNFFETFGLTARAIVVHRSLLAPDS